VAWRGEEDWIPDGFSKGLIFSVLRCLKCGGHYTSPRFPEAAKHLAFAGAYPFYDRARRAIAPPTEAEMLAFDSRAHAVIQAHPTPGRVLDIGMGDGAFLATMRRRGWTVAGIDFEPSVVAYAQAQLGIPDCRVADAELDPLPEGPFDGITLWGMFQLAYRPQALLEKIRPFLAPGGVLAIGVSNIHSTGAKVFGSHWRGLGLPRHLTHFDAPTLGRLLEAAGYRVLAAHHETPAWIVNGSVDALRLPGLAAKATRFAARLTLMRFDRSRWGDTLTLVATPQDL
jgi:SAM-dependent methyltransferase